MATRWSLAEGGRVKVFAITGAACIEVAAAIAGGGIGVEGAFQFLLDLLGVPPWPVTAYSCGTLDGVPGFVIEGGGIKAFSALPTPWNFHSLSKFRT